MQRVGLREIVLGLWKVHILHHATERGIVGNRLLQELRRHGYDVSPGTLYPLLHRMERNGWLHSINHEGRSVHSSRTYYLTPEGAEVLSLARRFVDELHRELAERPTQQETSLNQTKEAP